MRLGHDIQLEDNSKPIYIPAYQLPKSHEVTDELIKDMLENIVIESSTSSNAPLLLVPKPDGLFI